VGLDGCAPFKEVSSRFFGRLGRQNVDDSIVPATCEILSGTAGALGVALWSIGSQGCSFCEQRKEKIQIAGVSQRVGLGSDKQSETEGRSVRFEKLLPPFVEMY
jgi:hypothetical protein